MIVNDRRSALVFPPAKLNLGLRILGRREDGFHALETAMIPIGWHDTLEIERVQGRLESGEKWNLACFGMPIPGGDRGNLVVRAYEILDAEFDLPATAFHLVKTIPMGAGLGGGSSDGAHALMGLNVLYGLGLDRKALAEFAGVLGSDCPFFIGDRPAWVSGRGDEVRPWNMEDRIGLEGCFVAVIFPGVHVNTAEAFADLDAGAFEEPERVNAAETGSETWSGALKGPAAEWGEQLANDFQPHVSGHHPEIGRAIEMLKREGALWAMMSGSGSTVFGLFDQRPARPTDLPETWRWWAGAL